MTATTRSATVAPAPVVNYHGSLPEWHGLWYVTNNYGTRLDLRDAYGNKLRCRATSVTIVKMPRFTEARAEALMDLRRLRLGRIAAGAIRSWLLANKLIETDDDRPGHYKLTHLGFAAEAAIRPFYYGGMPADPPAAAQ